MTDVPDTDEELSGCELGTKEFWENSYSNEIRNYKSHGDVGEVREIIDNFRLQSVC